MACENFYFHIGLHKTGTTFLQKLVFPKWPDIQYLRHRNLEYFLRLSNEQKYLISSEGLSGRTFATLDERCRGIDRLAQMFPGANLVIGLRPHGGFMASLYSQYLRYGGSEDFDAFFSVTAPQEEVIWSRNDLCYRTLIERLATAFAKPPFVFMLDELRSNSDGLLNDMADYFGTTRPAPISREERALNVGLGSWQGQLLRTINRRAGITHSTDGRNRPFPKLKRWRLDPTTLCHRLLARLPAGPLVPVEKISEIDAEYRDDWAFVVEYIEVSPYRNL